MKLLILLLLGFISRAEELKLIEGLKLEALAKNEKWTLPGDSPGQILILDKQSALIVKESKVRFYSFAKNKFLDSKPMTLPKDCTRLALIANSGMAQRSLYCYGNNKKNSGDSIRLFTNGSFKTIIETPKKISAVTGDSNRIFFISTDGLFQIRIHEGVKPVFASSFLNGIESMAFDAKNDLIYLSSKDQIFSLRGGVLDVLAKGIGGDVILMGEALLILDSTNKLWRLTGSEDLLTRSRL